MVGLGFLEILDRRGRVAHRHRIASLPLTIGRAYSNEVILDDPYVSPRHVRLSHSDDALIAEDLGSENGLVTRTRMRVPQIALATGVTFRVGNTELRYCTEDQPILPTLLESTDRFDFLAPIRTPARRLTAFATTFGIFTLLAYLTSYERVTWSDPVGAALGGMVVLAAWAGGWAFGNRLVGHRFRFWDHFAWVAVSTVAMLVVLVVQGYSAFMFSWSAVPESLGGLFIFGLIGTLFYGHLTIIGTIPARRRLGVTAGIAVGVVAVLGFFSLAGEGDFSNEIPWDGGLKPIGTNLLPSVTVGEFTEAAADLHTLVDRLAEE